MEYLQKNVLPFCHLFMDPWISKFPHIGSRATSCAESGHAFVKNNIWKKRSNLATMFKSLSAAGDQQVDVVHQLIGRNKIKSCSRLPNTMKGLHGKISVHALDLALGQYKKYLKIKKKTAAAIPPTYPTKESEEGCTNTLTSSLGIHCSHRIAELVFGGV